MCGQKKVNKRIHKTLEINYNFPNNVYEKSKVAVHINITKKFGEWRQIQQRIKRWRIIAFLRKNDVQLVADGDRRRVEIELRQCDIRQYPGVPVDENYL